MGVLTIPPSVLTTPMVLPHPLRAGRRGRGSSIVDTSGRSPLPPSGVLSTIVGKRDLILVPRVGRRTDSTTTHLSTRDSSIVVEGGSRSLFVESVTLGVREVDISPVVSLWTEHTRHSVDPFNGLQYVHTRVVLRTVPPEVSVTYAGSETSTRKSGPHGLGFEGHKRGGT